MCDLCDGTTFCQLNVCSDCKSSIDNMEQNFNSLQQLKAVIRSLIERRRDDVAISRWLSEREFIDALRELSAV